MNERPFGRSVCTCIALGHDHEPAKCGRFGGAYRGSVCHECFQWAFDRRFDRPVKG